MRSNGLDWIVAEAKNYGIRLLLSLTNGDTGFGGMEQYVKWAHGGAKGGSITEFYTDADIRVSVPPSSGPRGVHADCVS